MDAKQVRVEDVAALRAQLRGNRQYRLEVLAGLVRISREHGIALDDALLENLTFADDAELDLMMGPDVKGIAVKSSQARR
jgi:hypothetical protein